MTGISLRSIDRLLDQAASLGFEKFLYCLNSADNLCTGQLDKPLMVLGRGLPDSFLSTWQNGGFSQDPLRRMTASGVISLSLNLPLVWENVEGHIDLPHASLSAVEIDLMRQCYKQGVRTGINTPIHLSNNMFALSSFFTERSKSEALRDSHVIERIFFLAHSAHAVLSSQYFNRLSQMKEGGGQLSPREVECLHWVAKGKNATEIADILRLSKETVRDHLKHVSRKLDASTRAQAVAKAYSIGYLQ